MNRIRQQIAKWAQLEAGASPAARVAGAIAIAVVPGAWAVWLAWRLLRMRAATP